jgi:hypothetical protein
MVNFLEKKHILPPRFAQVCGELRAKISMLSCLSIYCAVHSHILGRGEQGNFLLLFALASIPTHKNAQSRGIGRINFSKSFLPLFYRRKRIKSCP